MRYFATRDDQDRVTSRHLAVEVIDSVTEQVTLEPMGARVPDSAIEVTAHQHGALGNPAMRLTAEGETYEASG